MTEQTKIERASEREFVVTRTFDAPASIVWEAWTKPELMKRWWVPRSMPMTLRSLDMDVRVGGSYRLVFEDGADGMAFVGQYKEVDPPSRLVWTNEEEADGSVTTVSFEERDGRTLVTVSELYPSKEALEHNHGAEEGLPEQLAQLEQLLVDLAQGR
jgi:uncharacterized protein YndB with AHSA1/START domain